MYSHTQLSVAYRKQIYRVLLFFEIFVAINYYGTGFSFKAVIVHINNCFEFLNRLFLAAVQNLYKYKDVGGKSI